MALTGVTPQPPIQEKQNFGFMNKLARSGRKMSMVGLFAMLGSFASSASASVKPAHKFVNPLAGIKKEMTFDQQYKEAISNAALNAKLEAEAYKALQKAVTPIVNYDGIKFEHPIVGDSFEEVRISGYADMKRKLNMDGGREVPHPAVDLAVVGKHGDELLYEDIHSPYDGVLVSSGITTKGKTGRTVIRSLNRRASLGFLHIRTLTEVAKRNAEIKQGKKVHPNSDYIVNPRTQKPFKPGDTILAGEVFGEISGVRPGERHGGLLHVDVRGMLDGKQIEPQVLNGILSGFLGKKTVKTTELARKIGPSGTRAILNDMRIDEMYQQIEQENADRYDILTQKGTINAITDRIEGGLNKKTKTNFGLQWIDNKEELREKGFKNIAEVTQEAATEVLNEKYLVGNGLDKLETYGMKKFDKNGQENRIDERAMLLAYNMVMHFGPNRGVMKAIKKSGGDYTKILSNLKYRYASTTHHKENFAARYVTLKNMTREMTARMESGAEVELKGNFAERKKRLDNIVAPMLETEKEQVFAALVQKTEREKEVLEKANLLADTKSSSEQKSVDEGTRRLPVRKEELEIVSAMISQKPEAAVDAPSAFHAAGGNPPAEISISGNESFEKLQEVFTAKLAAKIAAKAEMKVVVGPVAKEEAVEKAVVTNWNDNKKLSQLLEEEELLDEVQMIPVKRLGLAMRLAA